MVKSWHDSPVFYIAVIASASVIAGVVTAVVSKKILTDTSATTKTQSQNII